jgi:hypothetical protein
MDFATYLGLDVRDGKVPVDESLVELGDVRVDKVGDDADGLLTSGLDVGGHVELLLGLDLKRRRGRRMKPSVHGQTLACGRSTEGSQEEEKIEPSCPLQRTGKRQLVNREALPPRQSTCGIEAIKASKMSGRTVDEIGRRKDEIERTSGIQQESRGGTRPREELDKPRGSKPSRFRRLKPIKPQAISLTTLQSKSGKDCWTDRQLQERAGRGSGWCYRSEQRRS